MEALLTPQGQSEVQNGVSDEQEGVEVRVGLWEGQGPFLGMRSGPEKPLKVNLSRAGVSASDSGGSSLILTHCDSGACFKL